MKLIIVLTIAISLNGFGLYSQNWRLGGNVDFLGANGLISNSNYYGALENSGVRMGTGGQSRIYMSGLIDPNPGYIGLGTNFLTPQSLFHINGVGNTGNLFQTTGSDIVMNRWVMSVPGIGVVPAERFFIENPGGTGVDTSFNMDMGTSRDGEINFYTDRDYPYTPGAALKRSVSIQRGVGDAVHGQVAMGNQLPNGFDAQGSEA